MFEIETMTDYNTGTYPAHGKKNLGDFLKTWQGRLLFGQAVSLFYISNHLPYARHYKPRLVFFHPLYTADNLCTKQGNLGLKSAVYNQERVIIDHLLWR